MLRVLAILYEHGPMPVHRIPRYGVGVGTAYRSAREAALLGLAHLYHCGSSTCIELTEKGREVAKHLVQALNILNGTRAAAKEASQHTPPENTEQ